MWLKSIGDRNFIFATFFKDQKFRNKLLCLNYSFLQKISDVPHCIKGCTHKSKILCPLLRQDSDNRLAHLEFLKTVASFLVYFLDLFGFLNCQPKPIIFFMSDWSKPEIYAFYFRCGFEMKNENKFINLCVNLSFSMQVR